MTEQRKKDNYIQEWSSKIRSMSDNRLSKEIKFTFTFDNYLDMNKKSFRISINKTKFTFTL